MFTLINTLFIRSLLELSDSSLEHSQLDQLVTAMYRTAGVREGSDMTLDDFKKIFASKEYAHTLEKATLNLDGKLLTLIKLKVNLFKFIY